MKFLMIVWRLWNLFIIGLLEATFLKSFTMLYSLMMVYSFRMNILVKSFFANEMGILGVDLDEINIEDENDFYKDDCTFWHRKVYMKT